MMRLKLLFVFFLLVNGVFAADWDLFPANQKMYFNDAENHSLDWFFLEPSSSPYTLESTKYEEFQGLAGCPVDASQYTPSILEMHKWHVEELFVAPNYTSWTAPLSSPYYGQFTYYNNAEVGNFWDIISTDPSNEYIAINIRCVSKELQSVFGVMDSVKTFALTPNGVSQGQVPVNQFRMVVSKQFGVLEYVPFQLFLHHPPSVDFTSIRIIGIEKPGFSAGIVPLRIEDNFNYQPGDILNWEQIVNDTDIQLLRDSITSVKSTTGGLSYIFDRRITDITGSGGVSYVNGEIRSFTFAEMMAYDAPPNWGDFQVYSKQSNRLIKKENYFAIDSISQDTVYRNGLFATELLLERSNCNYSLLANDKEWELFDSRYGLVEYGSLKNGSQKNGSQKNSVHTVTRLVVEGACTGVSTVESCDSPLYSHVDCDNGGLSNYLECLLGTDPFDPNDDFDFMFPVELVTFNAVNQGEDILVNWVTATEVNTAYFEIERRTDKVDFEPLGMVEASFYSEHTINYEWLDDEAPIGNLYYRLKQVDVDGRYTYSEIVVVSKKAPEENISIYPNPARSGEMLSISMGMYVEDGGVIQLTDISGRLLQHWELKTGQYVEQEIDLPLLTAGGYLLHFSFNGEHITKKLMVGYR